ncbi:MAG: PhnE/PtxC family ABC transporter permease, partial [Acidimicrobiales bacterium]
RAGIDLPSLINERGWGQVREFFAAMFDPDLSADFVRLTVEETFVTLGYALLGTALALGIGVVGGVLISERLWSPLAGQPRGAARWAWRLGRLSFAIPRSVHEVIFGLILINLLGLDPLVAVLAIGIPFGAVTAKVFSEMIDETPRASEQALRALGAGRVTALVFGVIPTALGDLLSYSFYRFECAIRSAAVLGIVGAGGLGFQLALSFQSLRYDQMWTLLWALILVSGLVDWWSSQVRRRRSMPGTTVHDTEGVSHSPRRDPFLLASATLAAAMIPVAWWWLDLSLSSLWSERTRRLAGDLLADFWPPRLGPGGWSDLISDAADTVALAVLALAISWTLASLVAFVAARPAPSSPSPAALIGRVVSALARFVLLLARSIPLPVWAFLAVFVFLPGLWPGVIALAIYELGVLGRLEGEVVENLDHRPGRALAAAGANRRQVVAYATLPAASTRFVALGLYRWEVAIRDTVVVGVVGAAGLGRRIAEQTAAFDYRGLTASILTLMVVTVTVDLVSAAIRRSLR